MTDNKQATSNKTPKISNNIQSKRPLNVSGTASSQKKMKPDPLSVMSQISSSLRAKVEGQRTGTFRKEINLLKIKEKKEFVLARKELKDAGVCQEDIEGCRRLSGRH